MIFFVGFSWTIRSLICLTDPYATWHCDVLFFLNYQSVLNLKLTTSHAESLFNAFATAAFFKFVVFSIFEMRYLLAIWKATRPSNSGEGWETMRRELSFLYSRFCEYLLLWCFFYRLKLQTLFLLHVYDMGHI